MKVGKTIIGKNRSIDVFCVCAKTNKAFAIECKYQDSQGTVDEKIPYALDDLKALPMAACIAYAGEGFSGGVLHMLQASPHAAYCLPRGQAGSKPDTRELDQLLAAHFGWWDVLVENKQPVTGREPGSPRCSRTNSPSSWPSRAGIDEKRAQFVPEDRGSPGRTLCCRAVVG